MKKEKHIPLSIALQREHQRKEIFVQLYQEMSKGLKNPYLKRPRAWLEHRKLSAEKTGVFFNSGQLHYDGDKIFQESLIEIGFRKYSRWNSNGVDGYKTLGNYGLLFPFRNLKGNIVNFYAIRIKTNPESHELLNQEGIYPEYSG